MIPYQFEPIGRHSDIQVMDAGLQDFEVSVLPVCGLLRGICVIGSGPQVQPPPSIGYATGPRAGADSALADERDMVRKIKTLPQQDKEGALEKEDCEIVAHSPLAGLSDAAVQLIRSAKKRG